MKAFGVALGVVLAAAAASTAFAQDAVAGAGTFKSFCGACHSLARPMQNLQGPSLIGVVGRRAGTAPGFRYSAALKAYGKTWTPEGLDAYLANPKAVAPKGTMNFRGLADARKRADVVAFLAQQK